MVEETKYSSKVDWWLAIIILLLFVMSIGAIVVGIWRAFNFGTEYWLFIITGVFLLGLILGLAWPVYYELGDDNLKVCHGLVRSKLKYDVITRISPSRNPLSSPALSLDRLKIEYSSKIGFLLISPKDKEGFMKDLASRTDHLEYINGELVLKKN